MASSSIANYVHNQHTSLPDGTPLPAVAFYANGIVTSQTGRKCWLCQDSGLIDRRGNPCPECSGTGKEHAPTWRWEE